MTRATLPFAIATIGAAGLVLAALWLQGPWLVAALAWMGALAAGWPRAGGARAPGDSVAPGALAVVLGLAHFLVLFTAIHQLARAEGAALALGLFAAAGLYLGQVSNPAGHELIHARGRLAHALGRALYASMLFGHHASAHRLVHHVHVATEADPNSARRGESLYRFLPRAYLGSFRRGLRAETARGNARVYLRDGLFLALCLAAAVFLGGLAGVLWHLALSGWAVVQLLTSDYVQHYGLRRAIRDGRAEPVGPAHSWDAPPGAAHWLMLNAPLHADHHMHPARPYDQLRPAGAPQLPHSLAVMGVLAFLPRRWRAIMDRRLDRLDQKSEP